MIDKHLLTDTITDFIKDSCVYIVDVTVSKNNDIVVVLDSDDNMDVSVCEKLTRKIEEVFDRDTEDYSLEVGSAGLTTPFKVKRQWQKNIGNDIEVLTCDGRKLKGVLVDVSDKDFTIEFPQKIKEPGKKKPVIISAKETISYDNCKKACYLIKF